jgi:hypothetical protein
MLIKQDFAGYITIPLKALFLYPNFSINLVPFLQIRINQCYPFL